MNIQTEPSIPEKADTVLLLPRPQFLDFTGQTLSLPVKGFIILIAPEVQSIRFAASSLQAFLRKHAFCQFELVAASATEDKVFDIQLIVSPGSVRHQQGYELTILPEGIYAVANEPAGIFYAIQTLGQLLQQYGQNLPTLRCRDWPDFPQRGVMLDISRDKVPTMDTLCALVDLLASWKVNQLQLYTEHTFAYRNHPVVWANASPMTGEEILILDAYCSERFIELVPNQNTFGHMSRWLVHEEYAHLTEAPNGAQTPWGSFNPEPFSLSPAVPASLDLIRDLLDELLPHFRSDKVNVGCDETYDLGLGLSRELVASKGVGRVYYDFLMAIYREVKARGRTMQFWGDIIVEHPELVPALPRDVIAMAWGYEADHAFDLHGAMFAASGIPFYVCPGTSSWCSLAGRTNNALGNLLSAGENGLKHGATGYLITDWGDSGHWQPLPVSYLGYAYGAAISWAVNVNRDLPLAETVSKYAFDDTAGIMGQLAYDLGNAYAVSGLFFHNASVLFKLMQMPIEELLDFVGTQDISEVMYQRMQETSAYIDEVMARLPEVQMKCPDADLIHQEYSWVADMMRHACLRALWATGTKMGHEDVLLKRQLLQDTEKLMSEHQVIWHARNRPGGFRESQARLQSVHRSYQ